MKKRMTLEEFQAAIEDTTDSLNKQDKLCTSIEMKVTEENRECQMTKFNDCVDFAYKMLKGESQNHDADDRC